MINLLRERMIFNCLLTQPLDLNLYIYMSGVNNPEYCHFQRGRNSLSVYMAFFYSKTPVECINTSEAPS